MKRTQSKAVKPKGAVKVPKGWKYVPRGQEIRKGDRYRSKYQGRFIAIDPVDIGFRLVWDNYPYDMFYIRRNPRADRAHKGRKV